MKKPKLSNLKINQSETSRIKGIQTKAKSIKITVNVETETLQKLKKMASSSGVPYQRLLNIILKSGLDKKDSYEDRLKKVETELSKVKKKLAA